MSKVRIDKWLWSVRIFKSRSISSEACKAGKVNINDKKAKPSSLTEVGDLIEVRKNGFDLKFKVVTLISKRVSATLAAPCYEDLTPPEELLKYKDWFIGKAAPERREKGAGRPTKKERRIIENYKEGSFIIEDE